MRSVLRTVSAVAVLLLVAVPLHSLRTLRQLRLVRYRKAGKIAYYSLDDEHVGRLISEALTHVGEAGRAPGESAASR